jgi:hypothetical protein
MKAAENCLLCCDMATVWFGHRTTKLLRMSFAYCSVVIYFMYIIPAISENDLVVISKNGLKDEERTGGAQVGHHHVIPDLYAEFLYKQK